MSYQPVFNSMPCLVELMGRTQIAGKVSEANIGGNVLLRVDVPATDFIPGFTKFYSPTAIYAITPISEDAMLKTVAGLRVQPVERWMLSEPIRQKLTAGEDDDARYEDHINAQVRAHLASDEYGSDDDSSPDDVGLFGLDEDRVDHEFPHGQGLVEYALIIALIALVVIAILTILGPTIGNVFSNIVEVL